MHLLSLALSLLFVSCSHQKELRNHSKVTIIKQWHPSTKTVSTNIELGKKLPEYQNQKDIYDRVSLIIEKQESSLLIAEGCHFPEEINAQFKETYNGWNYNSLKASTSESSYADIVTSIPLKLKAKYQDKIRVICGDDSTLIKKNLLALSDAKGFLGFYLRLKQTAKDPKKFAEYKKALEEANHQRIDAPVEYSKDNAIKSLREFNQYIKLRNAQFLKAIILNEKENPIIILGGLHAVDLTKKLEKEGIGYEVITPAGYPDSSETIGDDLLKALNPLDP